MAKYLMVLGTIVTAVATGATVAAILRQQGPALAFKMVASTGFLVIALAAGALRPDYGYIVLVALVCCWFGDLALGLPGEKPFLAGLVSFLLGHVGFVAAFWMRGVAFKWSLGSLVILIPLGVVLLVWMYPHVPTTLRGPVIAYVLVITAMVAFAAGAHGAGASSLILVGAAVFYVSDIFVARARFVTPDYLNTLVGLPLYYAAVVVLAFSVATQRAGQ